MIDDLELVDAALDRESSQRYCRCPCSTLADRGVADVELDPHLGSRASNGDDAEAV